MLFSHNHEWTLARSQQEARPLLRSRSFCYAVVTDQMLARAGDRVGAVQHTINFLAEIREAQGDIKLVCLTDRVADGALATGDLLNECFQMFEQGVVAVVPRPVSPSGTRLAAAIRRAMGNPCRCVIAAAESADQLQKVAAAEGADRTAARQPSRDRQVVQDQIVTLDEFMLAFCRVKPETITDRRKALLRNSRRGMVSLPADAWPHRSGQTRRFYAGQLVEVWPLYCRKMYLPELKPEYQRASNFAMQ